MKLSLALTTLLLSSTALAQSFEIECFDHANSKLFTINSSRPSRTLITWADGSVDSADFTKTESVKSGGCMEHYSEKLALEHVYQPDKFKIEIESHWSEGKPMTRCAGMGPYNNFEGTLSQQGKTTEIICKNTKESVL